MNFKPDRSSQVPIYKQIAQYIEKKISSGELFPDQALPSERTLAKELQVNRSTIVAAYDELEAMGVVERKRGSGTHISTDIWGISHKRIPNWGRYVEDGSFLPNLPLVQKLRSETQKDTLVNLASGELAPDLFPTTSLRSILSEAPFDHHLGYDHPQGNEKLRYTIAQHVEHYKNITIDPDSILITSGAQQALHLIIQCLLKPGDAIAMEDPSYSYSLPIFRSASLKIFYLPVDQHGSDPKDVIQLYKKHRVKMIFLNPDYQNPTGAKMSSPHRQHFLDLSAELGIPIVEDDPYSITSFAGDIGPTLKSMDTNGNVLYISSLSKLVASGLRIGWIIGPPPVIARLADAKQQVDFGHSIFPQWVAHEFLGSDHFKNHISMLREQLKKRRDELILGLDTYVKDQVTFTVPEGGIHLWCNIKPDIDEYELLDESLKKGVAFVPGSVYGSVKGHVRFTFGRGEEGWTDEGVFRFAKALEAVTGKSSL